MIQRNMPRPSINIEQIKNQSPKIDEAYITDLSSNYLSAKRRKTKIYSTRKTNEQLIKQSHDDLLRYIDGVDHKVQNIIRTHEAQFLGAYQRHIKRVREQMEEIRIQSMNNSNSQKAYVDKIDCLEKQLIIFRDQSLKLFDKIVNKDKQIFDLNVKVKELSKTNQHYQKSIYFLTRRNKELEAFIVAIKQRYGQNMLNNQIGQIKRQIKSQNKRYEMSTPTSKEVLRNCRKDSEDLRPFTSTKTSNSFNLRINSIKKDESYELKQIKQKLQEKVGDKLVNIDTVIKIIEQKHDGEIAKNFSVNSSPMNHRFFSKQKRKSTYRVIEDQITKLKSHQLAEKNQYLNIFKKCVEHVKKDIIRRNNIPSLNFFKENGPKNFVDFKKLDYCNILELFFSNQSILKKFYELIFQ